MRHKALFAAGGLWTPANLSPVMWVDASDVATITSSGGAVSSILNKGSLGGAFDQSTAGSKPTTGTRTQNGLNVLDFDGGDALVSTLAPSAWKFLHDGTIHVIAFVAKRDVAGINGTVMATAISASGTGAQVRWLGSGNSMDHIVTPSTVISNVNGIGTATIPRLVSILSDPGNVAIANRSKVFVDGGLVLANNAQTGVVSSADPGSALTLGNRSSSAVPLDGTFNEMVILSGGMATETNRALLHEYMKVKWAAKQQITDLFTRANSTTTLGSADTGVAWTALQRTWGIAGNQAYKPGAGADGIAVIDFGWVDQTVTATITPAANDASLVARCTDVNNLYLCYVDAVNCVVYKKVAGTYSAVSPIVGGSYPTGTVMQFSVIGSSIVVKKNGATIISVTDTAITTGTKAGMRTDASTTRFDNFSVS